MDVQLLQQLIQEVVSTIVNKNKRVLIVHPQTTISNRQVETLKSYFQIEEWHADSPSQMFHDATVFLEVDQSFIVSSAQGLPHSPASLFLTELLLKDEPAILVPDEKMSVVFTAKEPNAYMKMLLQHMKSLQEFGCEFQLFTQLIPFIKDKENLKHYDIQADFITEEMIRSYKGQQLKLPLQTKITPLALDLIHEKGIRILRN